MHKRDCREESFDEIRAAGDFCSAFITHAYLPPEVLLGLLEIRTQKALCLFISETAKERSGPTAR